MKEDIINIIQILGIGLNEIVLDIDIGNFMINSIEFIVPDEIILHNLSEDGFDYELDFNDIEEEQKKYIWTMLSILLYN